jgi:D-glycero-alpha-D-manno-heptose 1-phosphate guanylyltransferase
MEAIILAGGLGTRLAQVVPDFPKPMAPVSGKPFLWYLLRSLSQQGFRKVHLSIGYKAETIQSFFGDRFEDVSLGYVVEATPLGTGGAIRLALESINDDGPVFVVNGDTFAEIDYRKMKQQHEESDAKLTVALMAVPDTTRYGAVVLEGDRIVAFQEKGVAGPGLINSGAYLLSPSLFVELEQQFGAFPEKFSFESEVMTKHLETLDIAGFVAGGYFIDIGVPDDYERAQVDLPEHFAKRRR